MSILFADKSWPKLKEAIEKNTLIILPIGQTEEHGMHLPVKTDAIIAEEVAKRVAEKILIEMGFKKIILISAHGNHTGMLRIVVRKIADEYKIFTALTYPSVMVKEEFAKISKAGPGGSTHGGEYETSLILYLRPELVNMKKVTSEDKLVYRSQFLS